MRHNLLHKSISKNKWRLTSNFSHHLPTIIQPTKTSKQRESSLKQLREIGKEYNCQVLRRCMIWGVFDLQVLSDGLLIPATASHEFVNLWTTSRSNLILYSPSGTIYITTRKIWNLEDPTNFQLCDLHIHLQVFALGSSGFRNL